MEVSNITCHDITVTLGTAQILCDKATTAEKYTLLCMKRKITLVKSGLLSLSYQIWSR
jgi:hypothetical protein